MWGDALKLLVRIINATPTSALPDKTPYEAWNSRKPDLGMLCTFGCTAYVHVQKNERNGLQPKSRKCIYLGFENGYKGWRCLDVITKHVVVSRDVIFDESEFPGLSITVRATLAHCGDHTVTQASRGEIQREKSKDPRC
jgi:hypothetical protein